MIKQRLDYKWAPSWPRLMQRQWKRLKINPRYGKNETFDEVKVRLLVNFKNALFKLWSCILITAVGNIVFKKYFDKLFLLRLICFNKCPKLHVNTPIWKPKQSRKIVNCIWVLARKKTKFEKKTI
jgi:hypothetical protein